MKGLKSAESGMERLVARYKSAFRIPENLNFYSKEDFKRAERKYIKMTLGLGIGELEGVAHSGRLPEKTGYGFRMP